MIKNPVLNPTIGNFLSKDNAIPVFQTFLTNFIATAFIIGAIVLIFMLFIGSFRFITSRGDKEGTQKAAKNLTSALIGIVILFSVYAIIRLVGFLFGINLLQLNFPRFS